MITENYIERQACKAFLLQGFIFSLIAVSVLSFMHDIHYNPLICQSQKLLVLLSQA